MPLRHFEQLAQPRGALLGVMVKRPRARTRLGRQAGDVKGERSHIGQRSKGEEALQFTGCLLYTSRCV